MKRCTPFGLGLSTLAVLVLGLGPPLLANWTVDQNAVATGPMRIPDINVATFDIGTLPAAEVNTVALTSPVGHNAVMTVEGGAASFDAMKETVASTTNLSITTTFFIGANNAIGPTSTNGPNGAFYTSANRSNTATFLGMEKGGAALGAVDLAPTQTTFTNGDNTAIGPTSTNGPNMSFTITSTSATRANTAIGHDRPNDALAITGTSATTVNGDSGTWEVSLAHIV